MTRSLLPKLWGDDKSGDVFSKLHREIDRVFDDFHVRENWPFGTLATGNGKMAPRMDVSETDGALEVTAELPGVEEKDIDVSLADDVLTIKGEKKSETKTEEKDYRMVERTYGAFERSIRLPCQVKHDKIDAAFKNGVLTVKLPKSREAKEKVKKIAVKAG